MTLTLAAAAAFSSMPSSVRPVENPFATTDALTLALKQYGETVDYQKIVGPQPPNLMLGEWHEYDSGRQELIANMRAFRSMGYTHLAMEAFDTNLNVILAQYDGSPSSRISLMQYLEKQGMLTWLPSMSGLTQKINEYLAVLDAAQSQDIVVVGINMPIPIQASAPSFQKLTSARNWWMAQNILAIQNQHPGSKVIVLIGKDHCDKKDPFNVIGMVDANMHATTVDLSGKQELEKSALTLHLENSRFMFPNRALFPNSSIPFDWILHLPEHGERCI